MTGSPRACVEEPKHDNEGIAITGAVTRRSTPNTRLLILTAAVAAEGAYAEMLGDRLRGFEHGLEMLALSVLDVLAHAQVPPAGM